MPFLSFTPKIGVAGTRTTITVVSVHYRYLTNSMSMTNPPSFWKGETFRRAKALSLAERALFDCGVSPLSLSCAGQAEAAGKRGGAMQTKDEVTLHSQYVSSAWYSIVTSLHLLKRES